MNWLELQTLYQMYANGPYCSQCGKSLLCKECGQFKQESPMIDNAVKPWRFCSEKCKKKFSKGLIEEEKRGNHEKSLL